MVVMAKRGQLRLETGVVVVLAIVSTMLVWLPFWLRMVLPGWEIDFSGGMETVFANYDGPNYLIIARSWYDPEVIRASFSNPLPLEYYPAHLPMYPALVWLADLFLPGTWAMLLVTVLGTVLAVSAFYQLVRKLGLEKEAVWLSVVFHLLPARWLVVRSVGSPEPWFILFVLMSLMNFREKKYWWAGMFGVLAQLTKSPGVLLLVGYGVYFVHQIVKGKKGSWSNALASYPLVLIPLSVLGLFYFYQWRVGDFWAYFNSGDNFHLFWPPFSIFSPKGQFWTGEFWLEEIIWIWLVYGVGIVKLWKKGWVELASFATVFFVSTLFVSHRDIARYILPIFPLVLLGWEKEVSSREFKWVILLLAVPIWLYSWNFMLHNTTMIDNWGPYL